MISNNLKTYIMEITRKALELKNNEHQIRIQYKLLGVINGNNICKNWGLFMREIEQNEGIIPKSQCRKCKAYYSDITNTFFKNMKITLKIHNYFA